MQNKTIWRHFVCPQIMERVEKLYKHVDNIDVFVGGMLETTPAGPGELFRTIIFDQFTRIRDGDRFWFENRDNGYVVCRFLLFVKTFRPRTSLSPLLLLGEQIRHA